MDPERIVVFGASMGGNYAPLVAAGEKLAGVMIWGGGAKSWFERMLGFERRAKEFSAVPAAELDSYMRSLERFFVAYLLDGKDPATIAREQPALAGIWEKIVGTGPGTHYGRPLAFHQQAAAKDWAAAWERVDAPVLALYGEYDWFEDAEAHRLVADIANRRGAGRGEFVEIPATDHHFERFNGCRGRFPGRGRREQCRRGGQRDAALARRTALSRIRVPTLTIVLITGISSRPSSDSEYSTEGGEEGTTSRTTTPFSSRSRSRAVSILGEMPGMSR